MAVIVPSAPPFVLEITTVCWGFKSSMTAEGIVSTICAMDGAPAGGAPPENPPPGNPPGNGPRAPGAPAVAPGAAKSAIALIRESAVSRTVSALPLPVSFIVICRAATSTETMLPAVVRKVPKTTSSAFRDKPSALFSPRAPQLVSLADFAQLARLRVGEFNGVRSVPAEFRLGGNQDGFVNLALHRSGAERDRVVLLSGDHARKPAPVPILAIRRIPAPQFRPGHDDDPSRFGGAGVHREQNAVTGPQVGRVCGHGVFQRGLSGRHFLSDRRRGDSYGHRR